MMVSPNVAVVEAPAASVATTVTIEIPVTVGVPLITGVVLSALNPADTPVIVYVITWLSGSVKAGTV